MLFFEYVLARVCAGALPWLHRQAHISSRTLPGRRQG
jgi:hypothetical protein